MFASHWRYDNELIMGQDTEVPADSDRQHKLAEYLGGLHPKTQAAGLRELELSELRGDTLGPSFKNVMNELRRGIRKSGRVVERVGNPSRIFFMPMAPFLVNESPDAPLVATLPRASLNPVWAWICRDLMTEEARTYVETCKQALLADDQPSALVLGAVFQDKFAAATQALLESKKTTSLQRRLSAYGAPPTAVSDLQAMLFVMQNKTVLRDVARLFPQKVKSFDSAAAAPVLAMLDTLPADDKVMLTHALAVVMSQLVPPWQVVRLAGARASLSAPIAEFVVGRAQIMATELRIAPSREQTEKAVAKAASIRAAIELVRSELKPADGDPIARRCGQILNLVAHFERAVAVAKSHMSQRQTGVRRAPADMSRQAAVA